MLIAAKHPITANSEIVSFRPGSHDDAVLVVGR